MSNTSKSEHIDRDHMEALSVLVLDDARTMRLLLKSVLHSLGVKTIYEAADAVEAIEIIKGAKPDIGIFDYRLDDLDGLELTAIVRRGGDSPNPFLPIILCTAHADLSVLKRAIDAGVDEVLVKPLSAVDIIRKIGAVIYARRSFVQTANYFGPCRRRRNDPDYRGPWRRATDEPEKSASDVDETDAVDWRAFARPGVTKFT